jgi:SAM-dependent methyltransferase
MNAATTTATSDNLQAFYGDYYNGPSEWREVSAQAKARNITRLCPPPHSLLDVGAGDGAILQALDRADFGEEYYALDISASAVEAATARGIGRLREIRTFDGYSVPYGRPFDLVVASHVLEHVEHERAFLDVLRGAGRHVFIEVPLEDTRRIARNVHNTIGHINFYNRHTLVALLESVGLRTLRLEVTGADLPTLRYHHRLPNALARWAIRRAGQLAGPLGEQVMTYHCSVLCESTGSAQRR